MCPLRMMSSTPSSSSNSLRRRLKGGWEMFRIFAARLICPCSTIVQKYISRFISKWAPRYEGKDNTLGPRVLGELKRVRSDKKSPLKIFHEPGPLAGLHSGLPLAGPVARPRLGMRSLACAPLVN